MPVKQVSMRKIKECLRLKWSCGLSHEQIAKALGCPGVCRRHRRYRISETIEGHKTVVLDCVPTAENLAAKAFQILDMAYRDTYGNNLRLERVRLYETPNNWADATRGKI